MFAIETQPKSEGDVQLVRFGEKVALLCALLGTSAVAQQPQTDFESQVIEVILSRPEVVLAALQILERREEAEEQAKSKERIAKSARSLFDIGGAGNLAPALAPVLIEFFDYRCGYCAQSVAITARFASAYDNRVRLVEFPILGPDSVEIAKLAIALRNAQGLAAYRAFHEAMLRESSRPKTPDTARKIIDEMGIDVGPIIMAAAGKDIRDELDANNAIALALGINGTPAYVTQGGLAGGVQSFEQLVALTGVEE